MTIDLHAARTFVHAEARLLEQRVVEALFDGADPGAVVAAVAAYRNADGGFGHGMEPDKRAPGSQPLDVEVAFERLSMVGEQAPELTVPAFDYLASVANAEGAVGLAFPEIAEYPHASHWNEIPLDASLNPTASIAGFAHALGLDHPWLTKATDWCFRTLEQDGPPTEVHALRCVTRFLEHVPDKAHAEAVAGAVGAALPGTFMFQEKPDDGSYGLTPLEFAPSPTSLGRSWFTDDIIDANLEHLERQQQADGGWPIAWEPPSTATRCEWRGIVTLHALRVLDAYGRLP
jgi:hypothetical protein